MAIGIPRLTGEIVICHDLPTDKGLERQGSQHVQAEAEAGHVDEEPVRGEVVEHVALSVGAEGEEAGKGHDQAREHGHAGRPVGDAGEAVEGGLAQRAVDEERVVMADEGKGDDADGLEDAGCDQEQAAQGAAVVAGDADALGDDGDDDYEHADQREGAGFGELRVVSKGACKHWQETRVPWRYPCTRKGDMRCRV